jgi:hypothetical protein
MWPEESVAVTFDCGGSDHLDNPRVPSEVRLNPSRMVQICAALMILSRM